MALKCRKKTFIMSGIEINTSIKYIFRLTEQQIKTKSVINIYTK